MLTGTFIALNFLNTEYNIKAILLLPVSILTIALYQKYKKSSLQVPKKILWITLLYLIVSIISYFLSKTPNVGLAEITQDFNSLFLLILLISTKKDLLNLKKLSYKLASLNIVIQSTLILYQVFHLASERGYGSFLSFFDHRLIYPNATALSLLLSIFTIQTSKPTKLQIFLTLLGTIGLLFTYSRGAIIAFTLCSILYLVIQLAQQNLKDSIQKLVTIFIAVIIFASSNLIVESQNSNLSQKFTFQGTEQITSVQERLQFFKTAPELWMDHPVVGYGPYSYKYIFPTVQDIPLSNSQHPHNIFLKVQIERGTVATIIFIGLIITLLMPIIKNKTYLTQTGPLLAISAAILHSQIDYNFNLPLNSFLLIIILSSLFQNYNFKISKAPFISIISILPLTALLFTYHLTYKSPHISLLKLDDINYQDTLIKASIQSQSITSQIQLASKHTTLNPYDSYAFNYLGDLYEQNLNYQAAIQAYQKSIAINPKNYWYPYSKITKYSKAYEFQKVLQNLQEYNNAAKQNLHFTSQSQNINYAIQTTQNLLNDPNIQDKNQLNEIYKELLQSRERFSSS